MAARGSTAECQELRGNRFNVVLACGSKVLHVFLFLLFCALRAQKSKNNKKKSTALPKAMTAFDTRQRKSIE
jgi:hypothetical protein